MKRLSGVPVMRLLDVVTWSSLAILAAGCGRDGRVTGPNPLEQDFRANVSDPALPTAGVGAAFVSLAPGAVANAQSASIRNLHSGAIVIVPVVAGGFDPMPVSAEAGDTLEITMASGATTLKTEVVVPIRVRPIVVRTDPPPQKRDVPLNASIVVVFSEPIDPATLNPTSVHLTSGGATVDGTVRPIPGRPWTAVFTPTAPLGPETEYQIEVTQDVRDVDGEALEAAVSTTFTTVSVGGTIQLVGRVAFASDRDGSDAIYVTNPDGSGVARLAAGDNPAWSPDGQRIAFVRGIAYGGPAQIFVMNADGADLHFVADGSFPSWSPDGSQIAFSGGDPDGIFVMNADGSGIHKLIGQEFAQPDDGYGVGAVLLPAWSPDGRSIAFVRANYGIPWMIYIMNADGTAPRLFNGQTIGDSRINWSPDGSKLLYQAPVDAPLITWAIVTAEANGAGLRTHTQASYVGGPDWSPDAGSILFEKFTGPADGTWPFGTRMRIFVTSVDGGPERQLIPEAIAPALPNYWDHEAAWSRVK